MTSSGLRLCVVALALFATMAAAAACPTVANQMYNTFASNNCTEVTACTNAFAACSKVSCAAAEACSVTFFTCVHTAADTLSASANASACKTAATTMKAELVAAATMTQAQLVASNFYTSCAALGCMLYNETAALSACTFNATAVCKVAAAVTPAPTPLPMENRKSFVARIAGNFTAILSDPAKKGHLISAIAKDMSRQFGRQVFVTDVYAGSLVVEFYVDKTGMTAADLTALDTTVQAASTNSTWLTELKTFAVANGMDVATISMESIVIATPAPTVPVVTPTPTTIVAPSGAHSVVSVAATVLVAALVAALAL